MIEAPTAPPRGFAARLRRALLALGPTGPLLLVAMTIPLLGTVVFAATSSQWLPLFGSDVASLVTYCALGAVAAAACLLPTHATSLVAGFLFGAALGSFGALAVVVSGALLAFVMWQPFVGGRAVQALAKSPRAVVVHRALLDRSFLRTVWVIALLRLSPLVPFAATNILLAAFGVRGPAFFLATVLGTAPRAIGVAFVGSQLSELDWRAKGSAWQTWLAVGATVLAIAVVGRMARSALRRETEGAPPA